MLALIFAVFLQSTPPASAFTTVATGTSSLIDAERTVVIRTTGEWDALWKEHAPTRPLPKVDLQKELIVGVFLGSRPTAGFSVAITAIRVAGSVTTVEYTERRPNPDLMVAQMLTSPFHLVRIPRTANTIEFRAARR